jgi:hypothetical protein
MKVGSPFNPYKVFKGYSPPTGCWSIAVSARAPSSATYVCSALPAGTPAATHRLTPWAAEPARGTDRVGRSDRDCGQPYGTVIRAAHPATSPETDTF